jgi:RimJ/RimL family protein N-acetyltransferase
MRNPEPDARALPPAELREGDLRLRPPRIEEAPLYARWWSDAEVLFGFCSERRTAESIRDGFPELEAEARDIGHWIDFVIELDGHPLGSIWLSHWDLDDASCDLNILIGEPEYRSRGVARRAIRVLCRWAFPTMELRRIYLCPREDHVPAIRCYESVGAKTTGIREEVVSWRGETVCFREMYLAPEDMPNPGAE